MPRPKAMFDAATRYLRAHPQEVVRTLRNAVSLRFGLPLDALRWLIAEAPGKRAPKDVQLEAAPPGLRFAGTLDLMGTLIRASAVIYIEGVSVSDREIRIDVRLADVALKPLDGNSDSPLAALLNSGALDLTKPGNLAAFMPKRPAMLVEAKDDRISLDLMKHPKLGKNPLLPKMCALIEPLVMVSGVQTDQEERIEVMLRAFPQGMNEVLMALRKAF